MIRTMIVEAKLLDTFLREVVGTTVYIMKKAQLNVNSDKTPYELWKGKSTSIKYFKVFGSKYYMKTNYDNLGKFDSRVDEGIFRGYSTRSKAQKCYNKRLHKVA